MLNTTIIDIEAVGYLWVKDLSDIKHVIINNLVYGMVGRHTDTYANKQSTKYGKSSKFLVFFCLTDRVSFKTKNKKKNFYDK